MRDITADQVTLMDQAPKTILCYYSDIERAFVSQYGKDWVKEHADVIAQLTCASAKDYETACVCACLQDIREVLRNGLDGISGSIETLGIKL